MQRLLIPFVSLVWLAACSGPACPPPIAPTSPASATADPLPPPDAALARWQAIHANKDEPPAGTTAAALLPELESYLGSPDPTRRDAIAYDVLVAWTLTAKRLGPDELRPFALRLVANFQGPLDRPDGVFLRSFSALVLSVIAKRDLTDPIFDDAGRRSLLAAARDYANRETDLRGYTGERGWAHAAAHTADLLRQLAKQPAFTDADRGVILDAVAAWTVRRHGAILEYGEDGRLAQAVLEAARRGLGKDKIAAFLAALAAPLGEAMTRSFDAKLFAAQRNARNLLFTLFVQLSLEPQPSDGMRMLLDQLRALLLA
ncbi:MAG: DUF2785 domain-containing protein [Kofleriaceae bacterium]